MSSSVGTSAITFQTGLGGRTSTSSPSSGQATTHSGRHGGSQQHSGRGSRRNSKSSRKEQKSKTGSSHRSPFKGNTKGMNGHTFKCCDESRDRTQFTKALDALKEYAAKNLKRPDNLCSIFEDGMKKPVIPEPEDLPHNPMKKQEFAWQTAMKLYYLRVDELQSNLNSLYSVIWGQCSEKLKTKIRSLHD
jgi:hypothetical protein